MEVRPIKPDEKIIKDKIQSIAFMFKRDFGTIKPTEESQDDYKTCRAAFDDNGKMCSCFELIPYTVRFDGSSVPMGGIGGVASLPEERDKKYIRNIFEYVMNEMYEHNYVFSYLYPFSHVYYRKFGYEFNMTNLELSTAITDFKHFRKEGRLEMLTSDMDLQPVKSLYDEFIKDKNLAVIRTEMLWKKFFEKDPYKDNVYLYIWYNKKNEPKGYIQYKTETAEPGNSQMRVQELVWLDREALFGIFSFVGKLSAQVRRFSWKAPSWIDLFPMFPEPYNIDISFTKSGMNRVVNVQKALELMTLPAGSGEVVLEIEDAFFPINSGCYKVAWDNEGREIAKTQKEADLICDVQALSQLLTGFTTIDGLELAGRLEIKANENSLSQIFKGKKLFINNYF